MIEFFDLTIAVHKSPEAIAEALLCESEKHWHAGFLMVRWLKRALVIIR
jgi:hypothetical protein